MAPSIAKILHMRVSYVKYIDILHQDVSQLLSRYAMKCLDKKRIKLKGGESLALNERAMLSLVSTGVS